MFLGSSMDDHGSHQKRETGYQAQTGHAEKNEKGQRARLSLEYEGCGHFE
jgi:hypothetical protein